MVRKQSRKRSAKSKKRYVKKRKSKKRRNKRGGTNHVPHGQCGKHSDCSSDKPCCVLPEGICMKADNRMCKGFNEQFEQDAKKALRNRSANIIQKEFKDYKERKMPKLDLSAIASMNKTTDAPIMAPRERRLSMVNRYEVDRARQRNMINKSRSSKPPIPMAPRGGKKRKSRKSKKRKKRKSKKKRKSRKSKK